MSEAEAKGRGCFARANVTTGFVTHSAGRNIPLSRLRLWAVALIASNVRIQSRRNCHGHATARRSMTTSTTNAARSRVARMIESHVEAAQSRERFQLA